MTQTTWASDLAEVVLAGNAEKAAELTENALTSGHAPEKVLNDGLIPAMAEAGRRFEDQRFFLPELMFAARAMKEALVLIIEAGENARLVALGRYIEDQIPVRHVPAGRHENAGHRLLRPLDPYGMRRRGDLGYLVGHRN